MACVIMPSSANLNATLQELNDRKAALLIPTIVYVGCLMIIGFLGNIMVCAYFGCKARRTSTSLFISLLAIFDLLACVVSMPGEILDIRYYFDYENVFFCKVSKFVNHLTAAGSSFTLMIIAVDRHRRICSPLRRQIQIKQAIIACSGTIASALFFAWPSLVFYQPTAVDIPLPGDSNVTITGKDCTSTKDQQYRIFIWVFNGIYLLIFLFLSSSVIVLYSKIGRIVLKHNRSNAVRSSPSAAISQTSTNNTVFTDLSNSISNTQEIETKFGTAENTANETNEGRVVKKGNRKRSYTVTERRLSFKIEKQTLDHKTIKSTMIMISITAAFIVSCLPYLGLVIWRSFEGDHEINFISDDELIFYEIGIRSYLLQNSINPILYGVLNEKFRRFIRKNICLGPCKH